MLIERENKSFSPIEYEQDAVYQSLTCVYVSGEKFTYHNPTNIRFEDGLQFDITIYDGKILTVSWKENILVRADFNLE